MRVLTVGNMYPPHSFGGYELVWRSAVEHLRSHGHEVHVLTTDTQTDTLLGDDPDIHRELQWHLRDGRFLSQSLRERWTMARHNHRVLDRHLDRQRPDVVAWWSMGGLSLTMLETVRRRGIPAVGFVHDEWLDYGRWADGWLHTFSGRRRGRLAPLAEWLGRIPATVRLRDAAEYVFVSEFTRRRAREVGLDLERTSVAHSGINPDYLDAPTAPLNWSWRLLYVGRLDSRKGVDTAIRAMSHLPPEARLTIAGGWDEAEERRLTALSEEAGAANRVVFAGQLERPGLIELYDKSDAVLFPVRWDEPWGLVPLEAMGRQRPVVATGRGGSSEYLADEENCLLFDAEDPSELSAAVRRLADDPDLRARLIERGSTTASRHTESSLNESVEAVLLRAAAGHGLPTVATGHNSS
jgi:glycogen synthase